ncbi:MAG: hypothetical protein ACRD4Y_16095, partial [Candidatus Acidiferrales bacterium]
MKRHAQNRFATEIAVIVFLGCAGAARAQQLPKSKPSPETVSAQASGPAPTAPTCIQPPPMVRLEDYDGPFKKTIGLFARQLERNTVHVPHYKPGVMMCSFGLTDKFVLFVRDSVDPVSFIAAGFSAGISQAENEDPSFGQGAAGYGKRFGAAFADQASFRFFNDFAYPTLFHEDPRYYRLGEGSTGRRLKHVVWHEFVAYRDNGHVMFNYSAWLGISSAVVLSNVYHPGNKRGFAPAALQVSVDIAADMGSNVLREFWPEIARKFKLPFRTEPPPN